MVERLPQSFSTSWFDASSGAYISKSETASYRLSSIGALRLKRTDRPKAIALCVTYSAARGSWWCSTEQKWISSNVAAHEAQAPALIAKDALYVPTPRRINFLGFQENCST
jgi:hypothetical protein